MKRSIDLFSTFILVMIVLGANVAAAKVYRWVDENGQVHYSERPPANKKADSYNVSGPQQLSQGDGIKQYKKLQEGIATDATQKEKTKEDSAKQKDAEYQAQLKEYCDAAKNELAVLKRGGRIAAQSDNGEQSLLTDEQIQAGISAAQAKIAENCK